MARIACGVMGDSRGHLNQVLTLVENLDSHEYRFFGGGRVLELASQGFHVTGLPMFSTFYASNTVNLYKTATNALRLFLRSEQIVEGLLPELEKFAPDLVITSYEAFLPLAAKRLGIPCCSLDNQHFITKCRVNLPGQQVISRLLFELPLRLLYSRASRYIIPSFYGLPAIDPAHTSVHPPLLRPPVPKARPATHDHVLVYQTSPTFMALLEKLAGLGREIRVYGFGPGERRGNLVFRDGPGNFLEDLAGCAYAVTNGGHGVITEALFLGKPVLAFPIHLAYEQFFNAYILQERGLGRACFDKNPSDDLFTAFEKDLPLFRKNIQAVECFNGNRAVARSVQNIIDETNINQ